ncbi:hypothetical protein [Methylocystis parvus]|uniref:DUF2946 domain-containing protein n=1 Tax=Methylocystis parvus TaxID=134 RepID=A0A6B8M3F5_9HYPH|nr:hypothetical protein [Methylocystis parvus]QGM96885.1 hypothetical protein F7D14_04945 [Methylocystis parvus]WBJ99233.1 hypothetical protein MMG94_14675 [Methylocystis parvus OBBP]
MRKRLLASLIVCVALLTQLGASLSDAAAARGYVRCHMAVAASASVSAVESAAEKAAPAGVPAGAPAPHDHASCALCQLGLAAIDAHAPVLPARSIKPYWRVARIAVDAPPLLSVFNRSGPARAPPSRA